MENFINEFGNFAIGNRVEFYSKDKDGDVQMTVDDDGNTTYTYITKEEVKSLIEFLQKQIEE